MAKAPSDPGNSEKPESGSRVFETLTELLPYPMRWVGSAIFFVTCLACVYYLVASGLSMNSTGTSLVADTISYYNFETVELLLRVAAVALVLAALSGEKNSIVVIIGLLLVGALIVPTKDMVRIYLAATNSNRQIADFYGDSGGGPELRGRDAQLASTIVDVLAQSNVLDSSANFKRADLYWLVEEEISHERVTTLLERTRARGALEILAEIQEERVAQTSYRYGDDERHLATLRFLRNASLITYVYDDLDTIEVTELGLRVLHRARKDGFSAGSSEIGNSSLYENCLPLGFNEPHQFRLGEEALPLPTDRVWQAHLIRLGRHPEHAVFDVDTDDSVGVKIWVRSSLSLEGKEVEGSLEGNDVGDSPQPTIELLDANDEGRCLVTCSPEKSCVLS